MEIVLKFLLILGLAIQIPNGGALNPDDLIRQAETAYTQGNYVKAISAYEQLVDMSVQDGNVYFNLGNAYYQVDDLGRALLNYRRAWLANPRDADANNYVAFIRGSRIDIQGDNLSLLAQFASLTEGIVTLQELGVVVWLLWAGLCGLFGLGLITKSTDDRLRILKTGVGIFFAAGVILLSSRLVYSAFYPSAVVLEPTVSVMSGPGQGYLELFELHAAAEINLIEARNEWVRFELSDGRQGWIPERAVEEVNA